MIRIATPFRTGALAIAMLGCGLARAEVTEHFADPNGALGVARGPAAVAVRAALTSKVQSCTGMEFKETHCALADNALNADIHYGTAQAGRSVAFVSVRWQSDPTGNAVESKGLVFVAEEGSSFRLLGQTDLVGDSVRDTLFELGRITYATTYLRPGDSRSNPTGRRRYELPLKANGVGPVAIQRTGFGGPVAGKPAAAPDEALQVVKRLYEAGEDYAAIFGERMMANEYALCRPRQDRSRSAGRVAALCDLRWRPASGRRPGWRRSGPDSLRDGRRRYRRPAQHHRHRRAGGSS
ncbi:MAG: hypothetical protein DI537_30645 [Stutzerimonas stutzeri]|nr:MAG: hypothetical protein DI537_30645 [Stutzerimonas stutzeri]